MGSVSLTLPADFSTELNGKHDGMPAHLQLDSSSKGIAQRDRMPANFLQLFYVFVFFWTLEATLGTTLGPLFAVLAQFGHVCDHFERHFMVLVPMCRTRGHTRQNGEASRTPFEVQFK